MIKMYKIGDKFKPKGRIFNTVIYEITKVEYNDFKNETLYCLELIVPQTQFVIEQLSEESLNENYININ